VDTRKDNEVDISEFRTTSVDTLLAILKEPLPIQEPDNNNHELQNANLIKAFVANAIENLSLDGTVYATLFSYSFVE